MTSKRNGKVDVCYNYNSTGYHLCKTTYGFYIALIVKMKPIFGSAGYNYYGNWLKAELQ